MSNRAPDVFPEVEVLVDVERNYKQLLVNGKAMEHVTNVSVRFSMDPLAEVTVTFLTDKVKVTEWDPARDGRY
jgi:hypothetical protein